eukprot:Hpha_TRINITY_DN33979_c0_g1::TRINITY_DN33979_c0_g1_i1::g.69549::m.69549
MPDLLVYLQDVDGTKYAEELPYTATVDDLRAAAERLGVGSQLSYQGEVLAFDGSVSLADIGICMESCVSAAVPEHPIFFEHVAAEFDVSSDRLSVVRKASASGSSSYQCAITNITINEGGKYFWCIRVRLGQAGTSNYCIGVCNRNKARVNMNLSARSVAHCLIDHAFQARTGDYFGVMLDITSSPGELRVWLNGEEKQRPYLANRIPDLLREARTDGLAPVIGSWGACSGSPGDGAEIVACPFIGICIPPGTSGVTVFAPYPGRTDELDLFSGEDNRRAEELVDRARTSRTRRGTRRSSGGGAAGAGAAGGDEVSTKCWRCAVM